jgi:hypothetical protein
MIDVSFGIASFVKVWDNERMDVTTDVRALPPHEKEKHSLCGGTKAVDITEDVGLTVGSCRECHRTFVYLPKNDTWELEGEFENKLRDNGPLLGNALSTLSG